MGSHSEADLRAIVKDALNDTILSETYSRVERHESILMGNGKPGLVVRFEVMQEQLSSDLSNVNEALLGIKEELKPLVEFKNQMTTRIAVIVAASSTISAIIGGVITFLVFFFQNIHPAIASVPKP